MTKLTAREAREKQASRLKASTGEIQKQVNNVTVAPGVQAAKKSDKMLQNITASIQSGKWAKRVSAVSLDDWKQSMIQKGIPRISAGIDAAAGKVEAFYDEFFPFLDTVQRETSAMPDLTLEDNINRAIHTMRRTSEFRRKNA